MVLLSDLQLYPQLALFTADILTCDNRKSTGVANNVNNGCVCVRVCLSQLCDAEPVCTIAGP